ncbi:hypothetical protein ABPG72_005090 [Tetrahymena utriculariae]
MFRKILFSSFQKIEVRSQFTKLQNLAKIQELKNPIYLFKRQNGAQYKQIVQSLSRKNTFSFCQQKFNTDDYIDIGGEDIQDSSESKVQGMFNEKPFGTLTICPTPIGNLGDISIRQYQALLKADVIACEDTRITGMLFKLIKQKKIKESLHESFGVEDLGELKEQAGNNNQKEDEFDDTYLLESDQIDNLDVNQRLTREDRIKLKILELRQKAKQVLKQEDTLNIFDESYENDDPFSRQGDNSTYGLEDEFIKYLKAKIMQSKKYKGRGILISYHKYNEENRIAKLLKIMRYGLNITLVSDAGTPTISDPGYRIVNKCIENNIHVEALPGPNSAITALSKSGYPADRFHFEGYLPKVQSEREEKLNKMKQSELTSVCFDNVTRLSKTLLSIEKVFGEKQQIFLSFEMTKLYEKYYRGEVRELYELLNDPEKTKQSHLKGELTMVIPPFLPQYNKELIEDQFKKDKRKYYHMEWEDENNQKFIQVEPKVIASILNETLETTDQELANLLSQILRISRSRAMSLVGVIKHQQKRTRNWDEFIENYTEEVKRKEKKVKKYQQEMEEQNKK